MNDADLIAACLDAWTKCPASSYWPHQCDTILVTDFQGAVIFWPRLEYEVFSIVRLTDAVELDEEALPCDLALQLPWRELRLGKDVQLLGASAEANDAAITQPIQGQSATLQAEFDKLPPTVERALGKLSNAWTAYIGQAAGTTGATRVAAGAHSADITCQGQPHRPLELKDPKHHGHHIAA